MEINSQFGVVRNRNYVSRNSTQRVCIPEYKDKSICTLDHGPISFRMELGMYIDTDTEIELADGRELFCASRVENVELLQIHGSVGVSGCKGIGIAYSNLTIVHPKYFLK